ncbi:hypothetical protein [Mesorhizobium sp.]|uniref:hypothetical protein n=1 Tax=Mesorhizobium sp. TaxID=1871066 RepID=UPI0025C4AD0F|nr:hypothetical protein [Mesorhizobium sp.]
MTFQEILASILNPNAGQQNQLSMAGAPAQVGDHANPALLRQRLAPQMPQQAPQHAFAPPQGQPMPQAAPQAAPEASGGSFGGLGGIGGFISNLLNPQAAQRNHTIGWLQKQGLDEGTATLLAGSKPALQQYLLQRTKGGGETEFDQRAMAAQQYGLDPGSDEGRAFILSGKLPESRGGAAEMSLNTIPGVDENGNSVLIQVDKAGVAHKTAMPAGVKIAKPPLIKDTGTEFQVIDPITREIVQSIPKNVAGAAAQAEIGKSQGGAAFDLPRVEQNAQQTLELIAKLRDHPGRAGSTGFIQGNLPAYSGDTQDFQIALEQAKGQTFLQAYQSLKGGGQITEVEGAKAENAIARLQRAQSDEEFVKALNDFESVIKVGLDRAKRQAGMPTEPAVTQQPKAAPQVGESRYGYRFKGGDPSEPSNWEKAN